MTRKEIIARAKMLEQAEKDIRTADRLEVVTPREIRFDLAAR